MIEDTGGLAPKPTRRGQQIWDYFGENPGRWLTQRYADRELGINPNSFRAEISELNGFFEKHDINLKLVPMHKRGDRNISYALVNRDSGEVAVKALPKEEKSKHKWTKFYPIMMANQENWVDWDELKEKMGVKTVGPVWRGLRDNLPSDKELIRKKDERGNDINVFMVRDKRASDEAALVPEKFPHPVSDVFITKEQAERISEEKFIQMLSRICRNFDPHV